LIEIITCYAVDISKRIVVLRHRAVFRK
jgi:hypothetical protein